MNGSGELASRSRRLSATLLDLCLVFCFGLVLLLVTGWLEDAEDFARGGFVPHNTSSGDHEFPDSKWLATVELQSDNRKTNHRNPDCDADGHK